MNDFEISPLELAGAYHINNFYMGGVDDKRGSFTKCFEKRIYAAAGIEFSLSETFSSVSQKNVIRGLHFQLCHPQAKLVTVLSGGVWDVIVDFRPDSVTYKKWISIELSARKHNSLYIPRGFAHGFLALEDQTIMMYQCDGNYDKETDTGVRFDDPDINIKWPTDLTKTIHSERDLSLPYFEEIKIAYK